MPVRRKSIRRPTAAELKNLPKRSVLNVWVDAGDVHVTDPGRASKGKKERVHWLAKDCLIAAINFGAGSPFTYIDYGDRRHVISGPIRDEVRPNTTWAYDVTVLLEGSVFAETDPRMIIDP